MSKSTFDPKSRSGEHVIIVRHLAVLRGRSVLQPIMTDADGGIRASTVARKVWVKRPAHWAQHAAVVDVAYTRPGKRKSDFMTLVPNNIEYCTIETTAGSVLDDSRTEVPCDMAKFDATKERFRREWAEFDAENARLRPLN